MLRRYEARIDEQLAQADQLRAAMESVKATHQVRDGAIEVTVDSAGGLADLYLGDAAMRLAPADLAAEILSCARGAQAKLAERMSRAMTEVLGSGSETEQFVTQAFQERFNAPSVEPQSEARSRRDDW
jgi:DNA-binding protein YbaB